MKRWSPRRWRCLARALRDLVAKAKRPRMRDIWGMAKEGDFWDDYDPKGSPGEPPGMHRVEEGVAGYKLPTMLAPPKRTSKRKS